MIGMIALNDSTGHDVMCVMKTPEQIMVYGCMGVRVFESSKGF